eukprot:2049297-Prymnesium_polylepis.1
MHMLRKRRAPRGPAHALLPIAWHVLTPPAQTVHYHTPARAHARDRTPLPPICLRAPSALPFMHAGSRSHHTELHAEVAPPSIHTARVETRHAAGAPRPLCERCPLRAVPMALHGPRTVERPSLTRPPDETFSRPVAAGDGACQRGRMPARAHAGVRPHARPSAPARSRVEATAACCSSTHIAASRRQPRSLTRPPRRPPAAPSPTRRA